MNLVEFQLTAIAALKEAMENDKQEIILKSPTGSGKTIMLTHFMDEYCKSMPNIVFIWLTPGKGDLEEQSKAKMDKYIHNAQTKLLADVMTNGFAENDCCFINWEKLTKKGNNALKEGERKNFLEHIETARNNGLQFKIIVDESHQNDSVKANEILEYFQTDKIIRTSATPKGFNKDAVTFIEVPESEVIVSGLIKKLLIINENFQKNENTDDQITFLIDRALEKQRVLKSEFLQINSNVNPLIIVQLPNKNDVLLEQVESYFEGKQITYENGSLAIWLSDKKENLGGIENNDAQPIAVIIKQAVATGWDCPRAHILVKLRDNMNETFEIQTIGRIRRMPEAKHYDNELLDSCYLYTLDDKFTEGVRSEMGKGALNAVKLYLKPEYKKITLKGQYKSELTTMVRNSQQSLTAIVKYFAQTYNTNKNFATNKISLEAEGYVFSKYIVRHTVTGDIHQLSQTEFSQLNDVNLIETLSTHKHGREFHHHIANIGLKIGLSYDQMNIIARRLFGEKDKYGKRILNLGIREVYAFIINNSDKLRHDILQAMAVNLTQTALPSANQITEYDFTIPQETIFTYDGKNIDQSLMSKNVYKGYVVSAEPRSDSERAFEKFCESCNSVQWLYKNGDKGSEYFSIVYTDNFGKLKSFYPDYILSINEEVWIIETKGGFSRTGESEDIDKFSPKKFEVLKAYLKKYDLKGGFVRKDKQSQELCICTENYSDDIHSNDWTLLKTIFNKYASILSNSSERLLSAAEPETEYNAVRNNNSTAPDTLQVIYNPPYESVGPNTGIQLTYNYSNDTLEYKLTGRGLSPSDEQLHPTFERHIKEYLRDRTNVDRFFQDAYNTPELFFSHVRFHSLTMIYGNQQKKVTNGDRMEWDEFWADICKKVGELPETMTAEDARKAIQDAINNPDPKLKPFVDKCKSAAKKAKGDEHIVYEPECDPDEPNAYLPNIVRKADGTTTIIFAPHTTVSEPQYPIIKVVYNAPFSSFSPDYDLLIEYDYQTDALSYKFDLKFRPMKKTVIMSDNDIEMVKNYFRNGSNIDKFFKTAKSTPDNTQFEHTTSYKLSMEYGKHKKSVSNGDLEEWTRFFAELSKKYSK